MTQALPAPRLAEAYEVLEVVRRGGLSATFRARHHGSGELRCIDVLRAAPGERESLERRLDAEARPLMEVRHPNVARLVDAAVGEGGEACLVREDHDGITLRRLTGSQRPSVSLAADLIEQAAHALAFLHERGRKVGDLSPEGLLLGRGPDDAPLLVVADLGLAKDWQEEASLTAAGLFVGRLRYAAPEQFDAAGRKGPAGDVYALGLVAYELLTGSHPIAGDTASSLIAGHLFRAPTEFSETDPEGLVPPTLRRLVVSALAKESGERPTARALYEQLAEVRAELPTVEASELDRWLGPRHAADVADTVGPSSSVGTSSSTTDVPTEVQLNAWLEEAHALARDEEFLQARDKVRQVLRVQPDHSMGLMLLASLEACLKIQVEESKSHRTVAMSPEADGDPPAEPTAAVSDAQAVRDTLTGGTATVQLPIAGGLSAPGTETVRVTAEALQRLAAEGAPETLRDAAQDAPGLDPDMATQRLEALSQVPGGPASTERLDLDGSPSTRVRAILDDDKTRPLTPDLLRRVTEAQPATQHEAPSVPQVPSPIPAAPSSPPPQASEPPLPGPTPSPAVVREESVRSSGLGDGTTQLLEEELPGTVTMPMEQIEAQKRRALEGVSAASPMSVPVAKSNRGADRPMDAVAEGRQASLDDTTSPDVTMPVRARVRSEPPAARPETPEAEPSWGVVAESSQPQPAEESQPAAAARAVPVASPGPQEPAPASVEQLGFGGGGSAPAYAPAEPRSRRSRRRGRGGRRGRQRRGSPESKSGSKWILVGAALAAVLVFGFGYAVSSGVDLRQILGLSDTEQVIAPSELPPVALEPGRLVIDAAPWAEILQITDSLGEEVPLRFRHTPARYVLAPGPYSVVVAGPDGQSQTLEVEVVSDQDFEVRPVFEEISVDDYFRRMGWR